MLFLFENLIFFTLNLSFNKSTVIVSDLMTYFFLFANLLSSDDYLNKKVRSFISLKNLFI